MEQENAKFSCKRDVYTRPEPEPGLSVVQVFSGPSTVQHGGAGTVVRAMNEFLPARRYASAG